MITLFDSGGGRTGWIKILGKAKEFDDLGLRQQSKSEVPQTDCCDDSGEPEKDGFSS